MPWIRNTIPITVQSKTPYIYIYIYIYTYTYINKIDNFDAGGVSVSSKYNNNNINIDYI